MLLLTAEVRARDGVEKRAPWWSENRFGKAASFGPHRFCYGIGTVPPIADPETPAIGAAVLGITPGTAKEAYDRGARAGAATRSHAGLAEERARTAARARASESDGQTDLAE